MDSPIGILFLLYRKVIQSLHRAQLLSKVEAELEGLQECVVVGPNNDTRPPPDASKYYKWASWKDATLSLNAKSSWSAEGFREAAQCMYVMIAHRYLQQLELIKF